MVSFTAAAVVLIITVMLAEIFYFDSQLSFKMKKYNCHKTGSLEAALISSKEQGRFKYRTVKCRTEICRLGPAFLILRVPSIHCNYNRIICIAPLLGDRRRITKLCDPIWHVSSRSGVATLRTAIHLLLTYLLKQLILFPEDPKGLYFRTS